MLSCKDGRYVTGLRRGHAPTYRSTFQALPLGKLRDHSACALRRAGAACFGIRKMLLSMQ